jgi:transcription termination factor Rho
VLLVDERPEEVTDFKRSIKINLVFLAQEAMRERSPLGRNGGRQQS